MPYDLIHEYERVACVVSSRLVQIPKDEVAKYKSYYHQLYRNQIEAEQANLARAQQEYIKAQQLHRLKEQQDEYQRRYQNLFNSLEQIQTAEPKPASYFETMMTTQGLTSASQTSVDFDSISSDLMSSEPPTAIFDKRIQTAYP